MDFPELPPGWLNEIETLQNSEANQQYFKIRSHRNALRIYQGNYLQLRKHYIRFNEIYNSSKFWGSHPSMRVNFKRKTNQLIFNYLSSAAAIADISRKFANKELSGNTLIQYQNLVKEKFDQYGANNFIWQLRNFILHSGLLAIGVQAKIIPPPASGHWIIDKQDLENHEWEKGGKDFFQNQGPEIDLFRLLEKYNEDFISVQNLLYLEVLKRHSIALKAFAGQNRIIAEHCQAKGIWSGPPLGLSKVRHLYWILKSCE